METCSENNDVFLKESNRKLVRGRQMEEVFGLSAAKANLDWLWIRFGGILSPFCTKKRNKVVCFLLFTHTIHSGNEQNSSCEQATQSKVSQVKR